MTEVRKSMGLESVCQHLSTIKNVLDQRLQKLDELNEFESKLQAKIASKAASLRKLDPHLIGMTRKIQGKRCLTLAMRLIYNLRRIFHKKVIKVHLDEYKTLLTLQNDPNRQSLRTSLVHSIYKANIDYTALSYQYLAPKNYDALKIAIDRSNRMYGKDNYKYEPRKLQAHELESHPGLLKI
jgi:hypothetical protein